MWECVQKHNFTREALWSVKTWGSPEGTARLEESLAGQQVNKIWEGSVSLQGQELWEDRTVYHRD